MRARSAERDRDKLSAMATKPNDIKVVMITLSKAVSALAGDVAYLKAEHQAFLAALKEYNPELSDTLEKLRRQDDYRTNRGAYASDLANIAEAVSKIQMMGFDTWESLLKQG